VPAISFNGDADTGIFSPGDGKIAMVENETLFLHNFGTGNTALGVSALDSNITGASNVAIGALALTVNTGGDFNTAIGHSALFANTTGFSNTAVGQLALAANTSGGNNIALGVSALESNTTGGDNTAVGRLALTTNIDGTSNTAVGRSSLFSNASGTGNTAVGQLALAANTGGGNNIALGAAAGLNPTNSSNSIFIGNNGLPGDSAIIKIGTQGTQTTAFIAGIAGVSVANSSGVLIDSATGQLGTVVSSRRYKDDIAPMPDMAAMLGKLRPVTFRYRKAYADGSRPLQYGLIAEDVAETFPALAVFKDGRPETVKYHLLPSFLVAGWQSQQTMIAVQKDRIDAQAEEIATLKQRLAAIEARLPPIKEAAVRR
jgi:hypothetical protein